MDTPLGGLGLRTLHLIGRIRTALWPAVRLQTLGIVVALCVSHSAHAAAPTDLGVRVVATSFRAGTSGIYSVSVTNLGDVATDAAVHVTTTLPAGLSFMSGGGSGWSCAASGQAVDCVIAAVPAESSTSIRLTVRVSSAAVPSVTTSLLLGYEGDTNAANNRATRTTIVKSSRFPESTATPSHTPGGVPSPTNTRTPTRTPVGTATPIPAATDLLLTVTGAGRFTIGTTPAYFIVITNLGTNHTNVPMTIVDTLPTGISFVAAAGDGWTCAPSQQIVNCINPNPLTSGSTTSFTLSVSVASAAYPSVTNLVSLAYAADIDPTNNNARRPTTVRRPRGSGVLASRTATPASVTTPPTPTRTPTATPLLAGTPTASSAAATDLALANATNGSFRVGSPGVYTLTVLNAGTADTNAPITVVDTLPSSLSLVSASASGGWSCTAAGQVITCTHAAALVVFGRTAVSLTVNVSSAAFPTVTNTATLSYPGDTDPSNNTAKRPTTVRN